MGRFGRSSRNYVLPDVDAPNVPEHGDQPGRAHSLPDRSRVLGTPLAAARVHVHEVRPRVTDEEILAWAAGYLAGAAAAARDPDLETPPARQWSVRDLERAGRRRLWDLMVLAGEVPTDEEIERRLWEHPNT